MEELKENYLKVLESDDFKLYRALRSINPSPYLFYFDFGGFRIFGSSPETHCKIEGRRATIDPIAGTTHRSGDRQEDDRLTAALLADPKENAEHVMLVDLARNDLSRNCHNVRVEYYSYHVAKHGNYGATSVSGASNVMELHGVRFTCDTGRLERSLATCGMAYLHAPLFNSAMKHVANVRREIGVRTLFNLLGPLINPCRPIYQLLGVADLAQMRLYTNTLQQLGVGYAVVNNLDGYDEISLTDEFKVMTNRYETIYRPAELGFSVARREELYGGTTPQEAARIFDQVLGNRATRAQTDCVLINASFAIQAIDPMRDIESCVGIARESLESGKALATLKKFIELNS